MTSPLVNIDISYGFAYAAWIRISLGRTYEVENGNSYFRAFAFMNRLTPRVLW